jgi:hypothetical protein
MGVYLEIHQHAGEFFDVCGNEGVDRCQKAVIIESDVLPPPFPR